MADETQNQFCDVVRRNITLTNGFIKKAQKTPLSEIAETQQFRQDYLSLRGVNVMMEFNTFLEQQLQDPEVKKEYDALEPEFAFVQAKIDARKAAGLTQKELSERTGIAQADIRKLESSS